eukprot:364096-Chlamydomonas_euryale.AAC.6
MCDHQRQGCGQVSICRWCRSPNALQYRTRFQRKPTKVADGILLHDESIACCCCGGCSTAAAGVSLKPQRGEGCRKAPGFLCPR